MELSTEKKLLRKRMSGTTSEQDKTLPKMISISTAVDIGGFFKNLSELKASVDRGFEKYGDVSFQEEPGGYLYLKSPLTTITRLETPEEVDARITEEQLAHEHAVNTIENIARNHGLTLRWE